MGVIENVEAWELMQLYSRIKDRVRLTAKNFDMMTQIDKCFGEMSRVHTLATDVGLAAIGQIRNTQWAVGVERRRHSRITLPSGNQVQSGGKNASVNGWGIPPKVRS